MTDITGYLKWLAELNTVEGVEALLTGLDVATLVEIAEAISTVHCPSGRDAEQLIAAIAEGTVGFRELIKKTVAGAA